MPKRQANLTSRINPYSLTILPFDLITRVTRDPRRAQLDEMARNKNNDLPLRENNSRYLAKDPKLLENNQHPCGMFGPQNLDATILATHRSNQNGSHHES